MKAIERMNRQELQELVELAAAAKVRLAELETEDAQEAQAEVRRPEASTGGLAASTRGRGHIEWKIINGCGPYAYLRYWEGGRLKSKYLGKNPNA